MTRLICHKMAKDAIPSGGGIADGVKLLSNPSAMSAGVKAATAWCEQAIAVLRTASEPNPYKNADDETIAAAILKGIDSRSLKRNPSPYSETP